MKALIAALLFSALAGPTISEDITTMRTRVAYVYFAQNFCAAKIKWVYSTTASLQLAQAQHSNLLSVNYAAANLVTDLVVKMSDEEMTKTCDDAMDFLRTEDALLKQ